MNCQKLEKWMTEVAESEENQLTRIRPPHSFKLSLDCNGPKANKILERSKSKSPMNKDKLFPMRAVPSYIEIKIH